jgi:TolB protein
MRISVFAFATNAALAGVALAQSQPTVPVNLFVADLKYSDGATTIGTPKKLTGDKGINSQPSFTRDGKSIYFVRRDSSAGQGDVYRIELSSGKETRVTSTAEMENSPTALEDGKFMVIRWTPETLFKQWGPWVYDKKGQPLHGVLPGPDTVGYFMPLSETTFAMMRPKSARAISIFDAKKKTMTDYDFGAANLPPQRIPGEKAISYTRVDTVAGNSIRRLDLVTHDTTTIAPTVPKKTVHTWTHVHTILMGQGSSIYELMPGIKVWTKIATFDNPELQDINAYVVSPKGDKIILISPLKPPVH